MERDIVVGIIRRFNEAGVRYLIAGGFAVIAHGYTRLTVDLDLILDLDPSNALKAIEILKSEGYQPKIPVPFEQFADAALREDWAENRNMVAFPLYCDAHPLSRIDLFVREPFNFALAYERRLHANLNLAEGLEAEFVSFDDLIDLKREASRPKDLQDIYYLRAIKEKRERDAKS